VSLIYRLLWQQLADLEIIDSHFELTRENTALIEMNADLATKLAITQDEQHRVSEEAKKLREQLASLQPMQS